MKTNILTDIADKNLRDYVTPEDVQEARMTNPKDQVCISLLEIIAKQTRYGIEDVNTAAFVAIDDDEEENNDEENMIVGV